VTTASAVLDPQHPYRMGYLASDDARFQPLRLGIEARLDGRGVIDRLARDIPPEAADLIEIAAMAYAADRLVRRRPEHLAMDGGGWNRRIRLGIPVRDPRVWTLLQDQLGEFLEWLTHDSWELEFSQLSSGSGPLDNRQGFIFDTVPQGAPAVLFSGGLDSAVGLASDARENGIVAVSVYTNSRMRSAQARLAHEITDGQENCAHLQYRVSLCQPDCENTQRTRGALFLAVGIGTAWALGQHRLRAYENGIGAINLPYLRSQHGPQATRSMHPRTLRLAESLASAVSGRPFQIESPFMLSTKAEAIRSVPGMSAKLIAATVSCDTGFASRIAGIRHCGACTSCLLRRQSLAAAGRPDGDAATRYRDARPANRDALGAMAWQVDRIKEALAKPSPWHGLVSAFPELLDVSTLTHSEVVRLYRTYVDEWDTVGPGLWPQRHDRSAA
jgi:7-cyano-7-deazaguanine synthase in queuosine biosynthesis